jgi:hypothetical protein
MSNEKWTDLLVKKFVDLSLCSNAVFIFVSDVVSINQQNKLKLVWP